MGMPTEVIGMTIVFHTNKTFEIQNPARAKPDYAFI
jgi:hypothetical protein